MPVSPLLAEANRLQGEGRLTEAETLYRRILKQGRDWNAMNAYAVLLARRGQYAQAESLLRKVLKQAPGFADARMNLGNLYLERGDPAAAVRELQRLLREGGRTASLQYNLGRAWAAMGRLPEALDALRGCLATDPEFRLAPNELGNILRKLGRHEEARFWYRRVLATDADNPGVWVNLGNTYLDEDQFEAAEAAVQRALAVDPRYAEGWSNLCAIHLRQGLLEAAEREGRRAIALNQGLAGAYRNLAQVLLQRGDPEAAYTCLRRECALPAAPIEAKLHFIRFIGEHKSYGEAWAVERALGAATKGIMDLGLYLFSYHRDICRWQEYERLRQQVQDHVAAARIGRGVQLSPWIALIVEGITASQLRAYTEAVARHLFKAFAPIPAAAMAVSDPPEDRRLRVGYLSADFHAHATAYLMAEVFELHDRNRFELFAYALDQGDGSPMRQRLQRAFEHWRDIGTQSVREAATTMRADGIDLLVDLKGYTRHARPEILALRPAPIQVNYLGYPGTMGMEALDYIIADPFIIPPTHRQYYREAVAYLPDCYQANDRTRPIGPPVDRMAAGLPEQGVVLCCFNHPRKITPEFFAIWCRVLQQVEGAVLWLLSSDPLMEKNLRVEAKRRGVLPQRLVFAASVPLADHLSRLRLADLFLDTFPCNAHTTASDALWAGVPLVTCAGETFASRVAGSLLRTIDLGDLITESPEAYEALMLRLAQRPDERFAIKQRLVENLKSSPLFDSPRFTRHLEDLYLEMWRRQREGRAPEVIEL